MRRYTIFAYFCLKKVKFKPRDRHTAFSLAYSYYICDMKSRLLLIAVALLAALALGSCHSSRKTVRGSRGSAVVTGSTRGSVDREIAGSLVSCAREWLGTPYRYGGNDRKGVDCSGLTCNVFERVAGIKLPRDSRSQSEYCLSVRRSDMQPGDLVFFVNKSGGSRINHVGLYVGDGRMIHASSSRGVMESSITDGYWHDRYYCSGRVEAVTYAARGKKPTATPAPAETPKAAAPAPPTATVPANPAPPVTAPAPTVEKPVPVAEIVIPRAPAPEPTVKESAPADTVLSSWLD